MSERQLGNYQLLRQLGEGGMAQVYLARDVRLGREVAVKVLNRRLAERSGFRERFLREARLAAALDHPHIVPLFDYGESDVLYLVMPFVSGGSLQDVLSRAPFSVAEVVSYGTQMTDALDYAHQRNVVHRDVKPANMLVHSDGRLMLSDFGLAKILDGSGKPVAQRGHPDAGTPEYMAPEQIEGRTDSRADIYGLGVVFYLLLTGHLPFTGPTSNAVMEGHLYRLPESPRRLNPKVTPAMEVVVLRALSKHPDDRYQRASELGAALMEALVAGEAESISFISQPSSPPLSRPSFSTPSPFITGQPVPQASSPFATGAPYSTGVPLGSGRVTGILPEFELPPAVQWGSRPYPGGMSSVNRPSSVARGHSQTPYSIPSGRPATAPPMMQDYIGNSAPVGVFSISQPLSQSRVSGGPSLDARAEQDVAAHEHGQRIWIVVVAVLFILLVLAGLLLHWVETTPNAFGA